MKLTCLLLPIAILLMGCGPLPPTSGQPQYLEQAPADFPVVTGEAGPNDIALFLAGKPVRRGEALSRLQQTVEYQAHQHEINHLWRRMANHRLNLIESWGNSEITPAVGSGGTVNYPFGGPDLLHVSAMFPQANNYVLMGLEPVGEVPRLEAMPPGDVLAALGAFRQATQTQLQSGYFITKDMRSDLERTLRGVTPILLSTVALSGGEVHAVSSISAGGYPGVKMDFADSAGTNHTAYYVAGDLSNSGFKGGYRQWVTGLGGRITYLKASSYLLHDEGFSQARNFFLSQSNAILQDDSGIPFRYFPQGWSFRFYGDYERPIALFAEHKQDDLRQAYATNPKTPLKFGSGYHIHYFDANLLLALKR